ncbi:MinD/ParA family ATP-binding protein [Nocardia transvalensis]|uniref:MinD/ParA family ATP-binding protein n=1 Tax=Nocardia transvalensis TaxID=37333 RepID=UPI002B4AEC76|nr:AAA family ATPase [Nocardia transvalensis]
MSRNNDLPMLPPWLSESEITHTGYEAPVQNLPHEDLIPEEPARRKGRRKSEEPESGKKRRKGWRRDKSEPEGHEAGPAEPVPNAGATQGDPQFQRSQPQTELPPLPQRTGGEFQLPHRNTGAAQGSPAPGPTAQGGPAAPPQRGVGPHPHTSGPDSGMPGDNPWQSGPQGLRQPGPQGHPDIPERPSIPPAPQPHSASPTAAVPAPPEADDSSEMTVRITRRPDLPPAPRPSDQPSARPSLPEPPGPGDRPAPTGEAPAPAPARLPNSPQWEPPPPPVPTHPVTPQGKQPPWLGSMGPTETASGAPAPTSATATPEAPAASGASPTRLPDSGTEPPSPITPDHPARPTEAQGAGQTTPERGTATMSPGPATIDRPTSEPQVDTVATSGPSSGPRAPESETVQPPTGGRHRALETPIPTIPGPNGEPTTMVRPHGDPGPHVPVTADPSARPGLQARDDSPSAESRSAVRDSESGATASGTSPAAPDLRGETPALPTTAEPFSPAPDSGLRPPPEAPIAGETGGRPAPDMGYGPAGRAPQTGARPPVEGAPERHRAPTSGSGHPTPNPGYGPAGPTSPIGPQAPTEATPGPRATAAETHVGNEKAAPSTGYEPTGRSPHAEGQAPTEVPERHRAPGQWETAAGSDQPGPQAPTVNGIDSGPAPYASPDAGYRAGGPGPRTGGQAAAEGPPTGSHHGPGGPGPHGVGAGGPVPYAAPDAGYGPANQGGAQAPGDEAYGPGYSQGGGQYPPHGGAPMNGAPPVQGSQWQQAGQQWGAAPYAPQQHPAQYQPPAGPQPSLDDVPVRRAKKAPGSGWRRAVHHMSGGAINPGMSAEERRLQELVARIRQPVRGDYRIAVLSLKGGVGKTTTTMGIGSIFASIRGDRVIAVDANPDFGTLSQRVPLQTRSTVRDLLLDQSIRSYSDVRRHTSQATSRLEVLASERDPAASEAFSEDEYRQVARILQRFYNIILTDCGTGLMHSAMAGVLDLAHSLVLISSSAIDGARSAAATLDWLSLHGHDHLVRNAVVVINLPRPGSPNVGIQQLREYFLSRCRAVHIIPYDPHLSEGAEIDLGRLHKNTKRALVELAATVADDFATDHRRYMSY